MHPLTQPCIFIQFLCFDDVHSCHSKCGPHTSSINLSWEEGCQIKQRKFKVDWESQLFPLPLSVWQAYLGACQKCRLSRSTQTWRLRSAFHRILGRCKIQEAPLSWISALLTFYSEADSELTSPPNADEKRNPSTTTSACVSPSSGSFIMYSVCREGRHSTWAHMASHFAPLISQSRS